MKVLITGGAGFIGSHLAEFHLDKGHEVHVVDNFSTGRPENLETLDQRENLHVKERDILEYQPDEDFIQSLDRFYHLAAAVGVQYILDNPIDALDENINGVRHVIDLVRGNDVLLFLASTSEVYGKDPSPPFREDQDRLMGPTNVIRWGYANSKAIGEHYAFAHHKDYGLPVIIGRFFNVIGPRQTGRYGMVVPRFVQQCLRDEPVTVYGNGQQTRSFADVRDVVTVLDSLMDNPQAVGQAVNIGNDDEITIEELARKVKQLTSSSSPIDHLTYREVYGEGFEEMQRRQPELSRLRSLVSNPEIRSLDDTIADIISYYEERGLES